MYAWLSNETATASDRPPRAIDLPATHLGEPELAWQR
jgi:hypothetical protein